MKSKTLKSVKTGKGKLLWLLTVLFAIMASVPFLVPRCGFVSLFAFVPLLCMERIATLSGTKRIWIYYSVAFILWNAFTTFWVCNATVGGGIFAIIGNAFQMTVIFALFRWMKKKTSGLLPYIFLAAAWIAWEHFYFDAEISWPWLVLGNSFARSVQSIQWYEYTGTLGGSLWIWTMNIFLFSLMVSLSEGKTALWNIKAKIAAFGGYIILLAAPFVISHIMFRTYEERHDPVTVVALQPNIDPYDKFGGMTQKEQTEKLLRLADTVMDSTVTLLVAPETFTPDIYTNAPLQSPTMRSFIGYLEKYPQCDMIFGASTYTVYDGERPSYWARPYGKGWYESHNSALIVNRLGEYGIYHKIKLVPGVEYMPYPRIFDPLDEKLGGVMGRCVGQEHAEALRCRPERPGIGCAVCYESVYGDFYRNYVLDGAELMTIITNDAWWGDTPGYRQHLSYASLRAIETRRSIVRSANTGISALIDQRGIPVMESHWWKEEALKGTVNLNDEITFFVAYGDITGRVATFVFCLLLLLGIVRGIMGRKNLSKIRTDFLRGCPKNY